MKITNLRTNHIKNPFGFDLEEVILSFITTDTEAKKQIAAQIKVSLDIDFKNIIFDTDKRNDINSIYFKLPIKLNPRTRYYWKVTVWADNGDVATSEIAWFETSKMDEKWTAKWITPNLNNNIHPILIKHFTLNNIEEIKSARVYICGLGLYEIYINNKKCGEEYLTPNFNAYDKWIQYQTYDIKDNLSNFENNISVILGNGMYKGRFGFKSQENIYGDKFALLCEIIITYKNGTFEKIISDENWICQKSKIIDSNIYDGEIYDANFEDKNNYKVSILNIDYTKLKGRLSIPVKIKEKLKPLKLIETPLGETVIDMGQNMVGWLEFNDNNPKGTEIVLQYGEILQNGNFYRDNLRTAKAEFKYISNGKKSIVRPHFTFYGFRYVKVTGWNQKIDINDFIGCVLYSDMEITGNIETSNNLINRLFLNSLWGQKGNFIDIPTDCPQRDERMGWTGDAQVFSGTAVFNMDAYAFFNKYTYDLWQEQKSKNGVVPMVVPAVNLEGGGSSAWADASTIIPWNIYLQYGDKTILEQQFDSMLAWVNYMKNQDENNNKNRLLTTGFHFGDWLALDGINPDFPTGSTDIHFISSAYYYYSTSILSKAAKVLGKYEIEEKYSKLSEEIKKAIIKKYFDKNGNIKINTQTASAISLFMNIIPYEKKDLIINNLKKIFKEDNYHLKTGFVGTPYICLALSQNKSNDLAYTLLLNEECPSWLYQVKMGATTIWEHWDSILPNGKINGTKMNSLNHYAYGSIVEWMYKCMAGINFVEDNPGFREAILSPKIDKRLEYIKAHYNSVVGVYKSEWKFVENKKVIFYFEIPFNATATIILSDIKLENIILNEKLLKDQIEFNYIQNNEDVHIKVNSGKYTIICKL